MRGHCHISGPGRVRFAVAAFGVLSTLIILAAGGACAGGPLPPRIVSAPPVSAQVGHEYSYGVEAVDDDGDTLSYSLEQYPPGMVVDFRSGLLRWTPEPGQAGEFPVAVSVSDGTFRVSQSFSVTVTNGTPPPPVVRFVYPADGAPANRSLHLMGMVRSAPGAPAVERVEVRIDSGPWLNAELSGDGWSYLLDTSRSKNGPHRAYVRAADARGYSETAQINLTYDNPRYILLDYPLTVGPPALPFLLAALAAMAAGPVVIYLRILWKERSSRR